MKFLPLKVHPRLFAILALSFVIATIVGTVSHEAGHYIVGKFQGYNVKLHYAAVGFGSPSSRELAKFDSLYKADEKKILAKEPSPEKEYFLKYRESLNGKFDTEKHDSIFFTLGGPLQTMVTGTIGILWLWYHRKKIMAKTELSVKEWFAVIVAFFWSRQFFNLLTGLISYAGSGVFPKRGDEARISRYFDLPLSTVNISTGLISLVLLIWVTFYLIPKNQRLSFILAGFVGSALGFVIWMKWVGPVVLP